VENVRSQCRRLQDGLLVYVAEVLVVIQYSELVVRSGHTTNIVLRRAACIVMKSFICRGCSNLVTSTGRTSVDIGVSANLEIVDKFCYLGDMLSVYGDADADAAVEARIQIGWNKFRQLVSLLTNRDISLISKGTLLIFPCTIKSRSSLLAPAHPGGPGKRVVKRLSCGGGRRGRLYSSCTRSSMLHGSETWPVRKKNKVAFQRAEMRMVRWMCNVKVKDKVPSKELRERLGIDDITLVL